MSGKIKLKEELLGKEIAAALGDDNTLYDLQLKAFGLLLDDFKTYATSRDPLTRLEQICKTYLKFGLENPQTYKLMFIKILGMDGKVKLHNDTEVFDYCMECLQTCLRRELISFTDAKVGALQIWAMMHGLVSLQMQARTAVLDIKEENMPSILQTTIDHFLKSITR